MLSRSDIQAAVGQCFWWHSIDLGNDIVTPGIKTVPLLEQEFANTFNSVDVRGKSVLDVGAWNGAFTAEAARRGASHITAVDHTTWGNPDWKGRASFDLVVEALSIPATAIDIDLDAPQISLASLGKFDVVLFLGVLYHLQDPIAALREVAQATREVLVIETHVERTLDERPTMLFYPGAELGNDASNWWGPNVACVEALLRMLGFGKIEHLIHRDNPNRAVFHARW